MQNPTVFFLDLVPSDKQGPRVPCSDLKDDGDTCSDVVRSRCSPAHLKVSEVPWVNGEYSFFLKLLGKELNAVEPLQHIQRYESLPGLSLKVSEAPGLIANVLGSQDPMNVYQVLEVMVAKFLE